PSKIDEMNRKSFVNLGIVSELSKLKYIAPRVTVNNKPEMRKIESLTIRTSLCSSFSTSKESDIGDSLWRSCAHNEVVPPFKFPLIALTSSSRGALLSSSGSKNVYVIF